MAAEIVSIDKKYLKQTFPMKMFVIPCVLTSPALAKDLHSEECRVQFYIATATHQDHPLCYQAAWLLDNRQYSFDNAIWESIGELRNIAIQNNVGFVDLCTYALNYPQDEESEKKDTINEYQRCIKSFTYDSRLESTAFANELSLLSQVILPENDLETAQARNLLIGWLAFIALEHGFYNLLAELYNQVTKSENIEAIFDDMTYNLAVKMDCYRSCFNSLLYNFMYANFYLTQSVFESGYEKIREGLSKFVSQKIGSNNFKILNLHHLRQNLAKKLI